MKKDEDTPDATLDEIAEIEGVSRHAIRERLERAMKKFRKELKNRGYDREDFLDN